MHRSGRGTRSTVKAAAGHAAPASGTSMASSVGNSEDGKKHEARAAREGCRHGSPAPVPAHRRLGQGLGGGARGGGRSAQFSARSNHASPPCAVVSNTRSSTFKSAPGEAVRRERSSQESTEATFAAISPETRRAARARDGETGWGVGSLVDMHDRSRAGRDAGSAARRSPCAPPARARGHEEGSAESRAQTIRADGNIALALALGAGCGMILTMLLASLLRAPVVKGRTDALLLPERHAVRVWRGRRVRARAQVARADACRSRRGASTSRVASR